MACFAAAGEKYPLRYEQLVEIAQIRDLTRIGMAATMYWLKSSLFRLPVSDSHAAEQ